MFIYRKKSHAKRTILLRKCDIFMFTKYVHKYIYIIYFFIVSSEEVERCQKWSHNVTQQVDLAFNIFFMVYYFIRVSIFKVFF